MDKKNFIAIFLCIVIFYTWLAFQPQTKKPPQPLLESSQVVENKDVKKEQGLLPPLDKTKEEIGADMKEEVLVLESDTLVAEFSNIGGSIKKILIKKYGTSLHITNILEVQGYEKTVFHSEVLGDEVVFTYEDQKVFISKSFKLVNTKNAIEAQIVLKNKTKMSKQNDVNISAYTIDGSSLDNNVKGRKALDKNYNEYVFYTDKNMHRKNKAYQFTQKEAILDGNNVKWLGFRDKYFCAIVKPIFSNKGYRFEVLSDKKAKVILIAEEKEEENTFSFLIYDGPEKWKDLKEFKMDFAPIKMYYKKIPLFDIIAKFLAELLNFLHKIVPNWGICIILIGAIAYFSMYPLTLRSMASMKRMQQLQPKLAVLQKKYKTDPDTMTQEAIANNKRKLGVETMELYKKHNINPLGGCLPMFLQMPVFIGLYQVLLRNVSFKGSNFLWIKDLSEPDRLFIIPLSLPIIGNEINLLPLLMMGLMFLQQRFTSKNMVAADSQQAAQQKMMTIMFPLLFGFIFYKMPSGLTLYFTMFYFYSTFTQWKISRVK